MLSCDRLEVLIQSLHLAAYILLICMVAEFDTV